MNQDTNVETYYFSHARTALKYGLIGLNIEQNKEILLPDYICDVILHPLDGLNLKPVFYPLSHDLKPKWDILEDLISSKTAALMMVHFFGQPQEIEKYINFSKERNIFLIEDNAHGFGGLFKKRLLGTFGDIGISSPRKFMNINCGGILYANKKTNIKIEGIERFPIKKKKKFRRLINKFPTTKRNLLKIFEKRPLYEDQESFIEMPIEDYLIDKDSLEIISNTNISTLAEDRRSKYSYFEKFCLEMGLKPVFNNLHPEASPWCFAAYSKNQKEAIEYFNWGWSKGFHVFSWPTLPGKFSKNPSEPLERWKQIVCFSTFN